MFRVFQVFMCGVWVWHCIFTLKGASIYAQNPKDMRTLHRFIQQSFLANWHTSFRKKPGLATDTLFLRVVHFSSKSVWKYKKLVPNGGVRWMRSHLYSPLKQQSNLLADWQTKHRVRLIEAKIAATERNQNKFHTRCLAQHFSYLWTKSTQLWYRFSRCDW